MEEVFQNYEHYRDWILYNWEKNNDLDGLILTKGLMICKSINTSGESFRQMTRIEYNKRESESFIKIPKLNNFNKKNH